MEGIWNFNKLNTDTSTAPVSGRFKTNSGAYRGASQVAIHATTIKGGDRAATLRSLLVGDIIQCQDTLDNNAWCRYILQSPPVDQGTWFQLNVVLEADGNVASGDNQEIIFTFTADKSPAFLTFVYAETTTYITTTAAMAGALDSKPLQTDGAQLLTASITPKRATNKLRIEATIPFGSVGDGGVWFALFQDSSAAAVHAAIAAPAKNTASIAKLECDITAGTISPTTIKLRFGNVPSGKDLLAVNGGSSARWMGGASRVTLSITEHM
jgi:hypothetical protein